MGDRLGSRDAVGIFVMVFLFRLGYTAWWVRLLATTFVRLFCRGASSRLTRDEIRRARWAIGQRVTGRRAPVSSGAGARAGGGRGALSGGRSGWLGARGTGTDRWMGVKRSRVRFEKERETLAATCYSKLYLSVRLSRR